MNKAILMGRLTRDPELKSTNSGISLCTFTIAIDRRFKNAAGERETDFIPIVTWRQTADFPLFPQRLTDCFGRLDPGSLLGR